MTDTTELSPKSSQTTTPGAFRLAHVSDTHLGFEAYGARSASGNNQRGEDVVRAFHDAVSSIIATDPPLVIHSGDVAERPQIPVRYMLAIRLELARLAGLRADGTRRQVVVIAGNHDASKHLRAGCFLDLYSGIPGLHVVTSGYAQIAFTDPVDGIVDESLNNVVIHAVPHDSLRLLDELDPVVPVAGKTNVLTTHGVAESSDLYKRAIGREYHITADLMLRDWDYVALGHFHVQGPVNVSGIKGASKIWYAGSTENIDFGDVKGPECSQRGWLSVTVSPGDMPKVEPRLLPVRMMRTLPPLDATNLTPEQIVARIIEAIEASDLNGVIARQRVANVSRDLWALCDLATIRAATRDALYFRLDPVFHRTDDAVTESERGLGDIAALLQERVDIMVPDYDRPAVLTLAKELVGDVLGESPEDDSDTSNAATLPATPPLTLLDEAAPATTPQSPSDQVSSPDATSDTTGATDAGTEPAEPEPVEPRPKVPDALAPDEAASRFAALRDEFTTSPPEPDDSETGGDS